MEKRSITLRRNSCYHKIQVYKERREALRLKYGFVAGKVSSEEYKSSVERINLKIKIWNRQMKKIDELNNKIISLGNAVAMFTGRNVKNSGMAKSPDLKMAKYLFYKYGLENKIPAKDLREYVGAKRVNQPSDYRSEFNRSFNTKPENKETWERFKRQYQEVIPVERL